MRRYYWIVALLALAGCSREAEPVSNAATQYTDALRSDVEKAQAAVEKSNAATAVSQGEASSAAAAGAE